MNHLISIAYSYAGESFQNEVIFGEYTVLSVTIALLSYLVLAGGAAILVAYSRKKRSGPWGMAILFVGYGPSGDVLK